MTTSTAPGTATKTHAEVVAEIMENLMASEGSLVAEVYNQLFPSKIDYIGDSSYSVVAE